MSQADQFYDRVYLPSSAHAFTEGLADREVGVILGLLGLPPSSRLLDLGCGDGRHLRALRRAGYPRGVGLDRSASLLAAAREADPRSILVQGDYRGLPFREASFDGIYVWYAGLFVLETRAEHEALLADLFRTLRPGGRLVHDGANPDLLRREPESHFESRLPGGIYVSEHCEWREEEGREHGFRRLLYPDGRVEEGAWAIWHPDPGTLTRLLEGAGFEVESLRDEGGAPFDPDRAHDLVVVARRPEI
ncbi:MAG: methyltransferase domain-containing protein [Deltaproteobacteria bacterium]|nr:methyltransferase domain-containing protein [Deltaproteobacteria bacterium]